MSVRIHVNVCVAVERVHRVHYRIKLEIITMIRHHPVYKYNVNLILQKKFSANTTFFCKIKLLRKFCTGKRVKFLIGSGVSDA